MNEVLNLREALKEMRKWRDSKKEQVLRLSGIPKRPVSPRGGTGRRICWFTDRRLCVILYAEPEERVEGDSAKIARPGPDGRVVIK